MRNVARTPFAAVFQNEVLLNSKRIAPYALMLFFSSNAVLWSVAGVAVHYGWATNSEFSIARNFGGFAFGILGLPLFAAVIMADPVIRDFGLGVDPFIFSKPVSRAQYLLGKFLGSFFVLVCCQAAFAVTLIFLQVLHTAKMVVLPLRIFPYVKHFFFGVVVSYLLFAAVYFTVGTLTRNAKIVYGLAVAYYPLYIAYQVFFLKGLPLRWAVVLDPLLMNQTGEQPWGHSAEWVNQIAISYTPGMIANRVVVVLAAAVCLTILYLRFARTAQPGRSEAFPSLNLTDGRDAFYYDPSPFLTTPGELSNRGIGLPGEREPSEKTLLPCVKSTNAGIRAGFQKLIAALRVEFQLLRGERSLVVLMPLAVFISTLELAFYEVVPDVSYSASYASGTAKSLLLFLFGMTVFYMGEATHRDREMRIEPILWTTPAPNIVFLLSKFIAILALMLSLVVLVGVTAIMVQLFRGHTPVDISAYLLVDSIILLPNVIFLAAASLMLNVLLRDKYTTYALTIGTAASLFYLYSQGHNHWLYNPLLYQRWTFADLTSVQVGGATLTTVVSDTRTTILTHRLYCLVLSALSLSFAGLAFERKSNKLATPFASSR